MEEFHTEKRNVVDFAVSSIQGGNRHILAI